MKMNPLTILIGITVFCFLLLYFAFKLTEPEHFGLRFILVAFFIIALPLIPKTALDDRQDCSYLINSTTVQGNTTKYTYNYQCEQTDYKTPSTFFKVVVFLTRLFWTYVFIFILWKMFGEKVIAWVKRR